ncbi:MAG: transcriptional regulator [Paracoccaceae bacterium]|nr:MAG: transcriptional regulator [Paracoccaceae bacterium]
MQKAGADSADGAEAGDAETATLGERIAAARAALGLSVAELAQKLGVRADTVAKWEAGRSEPRANRLQILAGLLNVNLVWLITGRGPGAPLPRRRAGAVPEDVLDELRALRRRQQQLIDGLDRLIRRISA